MRLIDNEERQAREVEKTNEWLKRWRRSTAKGEGYRLGSPVRKTTRRLSRLGKGANTYLAKERLRRQGGKGRV